MQVYKYIVKVSKRGQIIVEVNPELSDTEVELTIVAKSELKHSPKAGAMAFVERWSGFLKNSDSDEAKYRYLKDKYK